LQEEINKKGLGIDNIPDFFPDNIDNSEIKIFRDENCLIKCNTNFKDLSSSDYDNLYYFNETFDMDLYNPPKSKLILKDCRKSSHPFGTLYNDINFLISASSLNQIFSLEPVSWLTEWYINAPKYFYNRWTSRSLEFTYKRNRHDLGNKKSFNKELIFKTEPKEIVGPDYIFVEFKNEKENDVKFIIHHVPDFYHPKWSPKLGIEYRTEWNIPNKDDREKISEMISFLFGRQLIYLGQTKFDELGEPVQESLVTPEIDYEINLSNISHRPSLNPIKYIFPKSNSRALNTIETHLNQLIPVYFEKRDELHFDEVFRRYWLSMSLPSYARLVILAGGLELLSGCWHKSNESKSHGKFLPKNEFRKLFKDELDAIQKKLDKLKCEAEDCDDFDKSKERIYQKVFELNDMGTKASITNFFREINLNIGKIEEKAIECRNEPAHGNILNVNEFEKLKRYEEAYRSLFNRAILKLLDYNGNYIDYYNQLHTSRNINEPIKDNY
jgi:hypothetical protein